MKQIRTVVLTGASTGIGLSTAKYLIERDVQVFGSVRRPADAEHLASSLGRRFTPLLMDVTDHSSIQGAAAATRQHLGSTRLDGLINNAGIAVSGPLLHIPLPEVRRQFEVNLLGPLAVTQAFAPLLGTDPTLTGSPGRILNMSSVAGKLSVPFLGPYVASKHGLEGMSVSLRRELFLYGIDVIVIGPGSVATPIWDKAEASDAGAFDHTDYGPFYRSFGNYMLAHGRAGLPPEAVARVVWTALTANRPKPRYAVVGGKLRNWTLPRLLPPRWLDRFIAKQTGLTPSRH